MDEDINLRKDPQMDEDINLKKDPQMDGDTNPRKDPQMDEDINLRKDPEMDETIKSAISIPQNLEKIQKLFQFMNNQDLLMVVNNAVDEESEEIISFLLSNELSNKIHEIAFERAKEKQKSLKFLKFLISCGANVDQRVLQKIISDSEFEIAIYFIETYEYSEYFTTKNISHFIFESCKNRRFETFRYLIEHFSEKFVLHSSIDSVSKRTILQHACRHGCFEEAEYLIQEKGLDLIDGSEHFVEKREILLLTACRGGNLKLVKYLMEIGDFDVNKRDKHGRTPLWMATRENHFEIVKFLIDNGAEIDVPYKDHLMTTMALDYMENLKIVKYLVEKGANVNFPDTHGNTPLQLTLHRYPLFELIMEVVLCFIESGANLEGIDLEKREISNGNTYLMIASKLGNLKVVRILVEKGVDLNAQNAKGQTALYIACEYGKMEVVKFLVENGIDIEQKTATDIPPIQRAYGLKEIEIVKYLIEKGASTISILNHASLAGDLKMLEYLFEKDLKFNRASLMSAWYYAHSSNHFDCTKLIEKWKKSDSDGNFEILKNWESNIN